MARILVAAPAHGTPADELRDRIVQQLRADGHDGAAFSGALSEIHDGDAVVAVLDGADAQVGAATAAAKAWNKPLLALGQGAVAWSEAKPIPGGSDAWLAALPAFYEAVRPFAGRVVRDRIPTLVKEAGHDVRFREVDDEDRPRFLKQKVANEARELLEADVGSEKEEIADVLEALEAFIQSRKFDREDLKRIKEAKRKRRGGFDRVFVVESTSDA